MGTAWLKMDGDETGANITVESSNLSSPLRSITIEGPAPVGGVGSLMALLTKPGADGSYRWNFASSATSNRTVAQIANWIKTGQVYVNVRTQNNSTTEMKGWFNPAAGTQTFRTPPAPPAVPLGPVDQNDAARFLTQATFGPTDADLNSVTSLGFDAWIDDQFTKSTTSVYNQVYQRCTTSAATADALAPNRVVEGVWSAWLSGSDQLRQRVAFAYSQIFVVSFVEETIANQPAGLATYHDMLANDAFGNFRTLLKDVTLHPIMGQYLNMRGSVKPASPTFVAPNENYGREVNQLFSVGLNQLWPDGSLKLDANGLPIPTYDQAVIQGFAHVFTGWNTDPTAVTIPTLTSTGVVNVSSFYNKPMVLTVNGSGNASQHSTNSKLLLNGFTIPANADGGSSTQKVSTANAELDAAIDNIFNHPNVAPFICRQLIQRLVGSNPSPGYLYRVSSVFNNDGTGVRGNMKAVIKAILLDYEARSTAAAAFQGYGHLREPNVRIANIIRAFHPTSVSGYFKLSLTDTNLFQSPYHATTVFNFYEPYYSQPGVIDQNNLYSPEFQIVNDNSIISTSNLIYTGIYNTNGWPGSDVGINLATEVSLMNSGGIGALLDRLNLLLMSGQMPQAMRDKITTYIGTLTSSTTTDKVRAAVHLVATSSQYSGQK
jgi:uncharacterized protein (DUF1800 family)